MKRIICLCVIVAWMAGCRKDHGFDNTGTIFGFDYRKCMCCGGWFIKIDQDTLRFDRLPEGCTMDLNNPVFPVEVYLDWQPKDPKCLGDEITVTRMELKK